MIQLQVMKHEPETKFFRSLFDQVEKLTASLSSYFLRNVEFMHLCIYLIMPSEFIVLDGLVYV